MIAVLQRVKRASVSVNGREISAINKGILLLAGIEKDDSDFDLKFIANKVVNLRIFPDNEGKMNLSLIDIGGEILSVSQFTITSKIKKGRRPDFTRAMPPSEAKILYEKFLKELSSYGIPVKDGIFGAMMEVSLINYGPVTFILDSKLKKKNVT